MLHGTVPRYHTPTFAPRFGYVTPKVRPASVVEAAIFASSPKVQSTSVFLTASSFYTNPLRGLQNRVQYFRDCCMLRERHILDHIQRGTHTAYDWVRSWFLDAMIGDMEEAGGWNHRWWCAYGWRRVLCVNRHRSWILCVTVTSTCRQVHTYSMYDNQ